MAIDQSLVTLEFLWYKLSSSQFYKKLTRKIAFMRGGLGSSSTIWTGTRYELKILRYCGKNQKFVGANYYICGKSRGNTGRGRGFFLPTSWIGFRYVILHIICATCRKFVIFFVFSMFIFNVFMNIIFLSIFIWFQLFVC